MNIILDYQWEIFVITEIVSWVALLMFGFFRYLLDKNKLSLLFIGTFIVFLGLEALLGIYVYQKTGEISTFQIVITIFVVYACTFGYFDFLRLDRWMRQKIGKWRGVELLNKKDYQIIERNQDPAFIAKKYRWSATIHLILFIVVQSIFWINGTESLDEMLGYLKDLSWVEAGTVKESPYPNETIYSIGMIWGIIFIIDFIYSWSYTIFPGKK